MSVPPAKVFRAPVRPGATAAVPPPPPPNAAATPAPSTTPPALPTTSVPPPLPSSVVPPPPPPSTSSLAAPTSVATAPPTSPATTTRPPVGGVAAKIAAVSGASSSATTSTTVAVKKIVPPPPPNPPPVSETPSSSQPPLPPLPPTPAPTVVPAPPVAPSSVAVATPAPSAANPTLPPRPQRRLPPSVSSPIPAPPSSTAASSTPPPPQAAPANDIEPPSPRNTAAVATPPVRSIPKPPAENTGSSSGGVGASLVSGLSNLAKYNPFSKSKDSGNSNLMASSSTSPFASTGTSGSHGHGHARTSSSGAPFTTIGGTSGPLGDLSFSKQCTHNWDIVTKQVESGTYAAKRMSAVLRKLCQLEEEYAKEVMKVLSHESTKESKLQNDSMKSVAVAWSAVQESLANNAQMHANHAGRVMMEVVVPLMEFHQSAEERRKQLMAQERKYSGDMAAARENVQKEMDTCNRLLIGLKGRDAENKGDKKESKPSTAGAAASALFSKITSKVNQVVMSKEERQNKLHATAIAYTNAISNANHCQGVYFSQQIPHIFDTMEQIEMTRMEQMAKSLNAFADAYRACAAPVTEVGEALVKATRGINPEEDMKQCIRDWVEEYGEPDHDRRPFIYAIPCTPDDIKAGRWEGASNSIFNNSLQQLMVLQKTTAPQLDVPQILPTLIEQVKELNGYRTEGIFRVSPSKDVMDRMMVDMNEGNYNMTYSSPHEPAGLLKLWLRSLIESPIPPNLYPACIEAAKDKSCPTSTIEALIAQCDPVAQRVIAQLSAAAQEIASPANSAINLMTIDALAVVFAPSLMRCPSHDPIEILQNSKFEVRFVGLVFKTFPNQLPRQSLAVGGASPSAASSSAPTAVSAPPPSAPAPVKVVMGNRMSQTGPPLPAGNRPGAGPATSTSRPPLVAQSSINATVAAPGSNSGTGSVRRVPPPPPPNEPNFNPPLPPLPPPLPTGAPPTPPE